MRLRPHDLLVTPIIIIVTWFHLYYTVNRVTLETDNICMTVIETTVKQKTDPLI